MLTDEQKAYVGEVEVYRKDAAAAIRESKLVCQHASGVIRRFNKLERTLRRWIEKTK